MRFYSNILSSVGNTPLILIRHLFEESSFKVFGKLEALNPTGSSKDRAALQMVQAGLRDGTIQPDSVIVESSSGNMGISLAQICRVFGLRCIIVVDPKIQPENLAVLRAYGAEVSQVTAPDPETGEWLVARIDRVREIVATTERAVWIGQYFNRQNPLAHHRTMAEIVKDLDEPPDYLFVAVSTTGTAMGCGEYIREQRLPTKLIAVDLLGSILFSDVRKPRRIPGMGAGMIPALLDRKYIHKCVHVTDLDCVSGCRRLALREGILGGGSSGAVIVAIERLRDEIPKNGTVVCILPDQGTRYLSTIYDDEWVRTQFPQEASHLPSMRPPSAGPPSAPGEGATRADGRADEVH